MILSRFWFSLKLCGVSSSKSTRRRSRSKLARISLWRSSIFEAVDLPLGLPAAPGQGQGGAHGSPVLGQARGEGLKGRDAAAVRPLQPVREAGVTEGADGGPARRWQPLALTRAVK